MDNRNQAPYLAQDPQEIGQVISALNQSTKKGKSKSGFSVRKKAYHLSTTDRRTVDSWSMNDWDYKKDNLPTYARGLFTHTNNGKPEITIRGYDKFFNVNEVRKTEWANIESNTRGPYELSVKENGCIIFMSGLDDNTVLVTSKHATGPRDDASANHAAAGSMWLDKQLMTLGKTRADFAKTLRQMNATAVAELCDDAFEEHVLEYTPEMAGLYLHGINLNLPEFATYPGNLVAEFADKWGFRKVQYIMKDTMDEVKPFLEEVAKTGNYEGRDTEGFVIRCQARDGANAPWHDWFFKFKFEEPYLMYRQWREVTKSVIVGKLPKFHKHKKITEEYILYARRQLARDPKLGKAFNQNHGIIAMRGGFLKEKGLKGHEIIQAEGGNENNQIGVDDGVERIKNHVVLVPIATIGCGKTTVATALTKLFGWGHEQNDNIQGKQRPARFAMAMTNLMSAFPVVIADRNNHQRRERAQLIDDISRVIPDATFVALHWVHDLDQYGNIKTVTQERIFSRGDKHQTIHADSKGSDEILGIMNGFMDRFEPCDPLKKPDSRFFTVIDLNPALTSRENLATIVHELNLVFPNLVQVPGDEALDEAINYALNEYAPDIFHELKNSSGGKNKRDAKAKQNGHKSDSNREILEAMTETSPTPRSRKEPNIEYFGAFISAGPINDVLENTFGSKSRETSKFYTQLKTSRRVQRTFHVTLIHRASSKEHSEYWNKLNTTWREKADATEPEALKGGTDGGIELGKARVQLEQIVWDGRVMAILVRLLDPEWKTVNESAHITVGTAGDGIKPKESNDLLKVWLAGGNENIQSTKVKAGIVLEATVKGMLSR